ncbi:hypothetical protein AVEN_223967-1 [Araneus ventricosus]|uniref:Uncharacterized protein n=1 Tax=Araneus ventricosus TaxID=182803 RepID=A0A4Y2SYZ7_ARAVE|nr:hypothetical protein AVEN_223967-1 [Araneus ventricosus]
MQLLVESKELVDGRVPTELKSKLVVQSKKPKAHHRRTGAGGSPSTKNSAVGACSAAGDRLWECYNWSEEIWHNSADTTAGSTYSCEQSVLRIDIIKNS